MFTRQSPTLFAVVDSFMLQQLVIHKWCIKINLCVVHRPMKELLIMQRGSSHAVGNLRPSYFVQVMPIMLLIQLNRFQTVSMLVIFDTKRQFPLDDHGLTPLAYIARSDIES